MAVCAAELRGNAVPPTPPPVLTIAGAPRVNFRDIERLVADNTAAVEATTNERRLESRGAAVPSPPPPPPPPPPVLTIAGAPRVNFRDIEGSVA